MSDIEKEDGQYTIESIDEFLEILLTLLSKLIRLPRSFYWNKIIFFPTCRTLQSHILNILKSLKKILKRSLQLI